MGLEFIGPSPHLSALATAAKVCHLVDSPFLGVTLDFMHFTLGKSKSEDFDLLRAQDIAIVHLDDAPDLAREITNDYDRVYPGDGDYPVVELLKKVKATGFTGPVSLELFNKEYAQQDTLEVARTGYEKSRAVMEAAGISVE
jgi:sugar phosphate isomerase/epimerase